MSSKVLKHNFCHLSYDYIAHTETVTEDFKYIFSKVPGIKKNKNETYFSDIGWRNKAVDYLGKMPSKYIVKNLVKFLPKRVIYDALFHYKKDYEAFGYNLQTSIDNYLK